ncbi:hypothetical protein PHYPSEUDO_013981 [Phytophthora pseudosyringae]|uniref:Uncharacterized protein n=1 Tax=Phytophthora pseudosyringae TaxID=221518 RepID=A0A8T1W1V1_9STRA|nr:hypothetical protein PHYPSEUDO_013981 [Phytophthora pseudosyringae]
MDDLSYLAPPILINWNFQALQDFVSRANATYPRSAELPTPPRWLKVRPPYMTAASLSGDVVGFLGGDSYLAESRFGSVLLVPPTMEQYSRMIGRFGIMEIDPFMQIVMDKAPVHERIAAIGLLQESAHGYQTRRILRDNPAPYRQIFE